MKKVLYVVIILLVAVTACSRDESKKVVAEVGSRKITVGDLQETYMRIPPGYLPQDAGEEGKRRFLDDIIDKELLVLASYDRKLDKAEETIAAIKRLEQQYLLRELYSAEIMEKSKVTEKEIKQRYEDMTRQDEVHARRIVLSDSLRALDVLRQIRAGRDFAEMAKLYSEDATTSAMGGDLGFFSKEPSDSSEFFDWAFRLRPGEVSDAFKTPFGWHILKVEEKRKRQLDPYDKLKTQLESMLIMDKRRTLATNFVEKTRKTHNLVLDDETIRVLAQGVWACTTEAEATPREIEKRFSAEQRATVLATTKEGKYTIADFVKSLEAGGVTALPTTTTFEEIRGMVESEAITEPLAVEARKLKIHKRPAVKKDLVRLREEKMVETLYQKFVRDSVKMSDTEVFEHYRENQEKYGTPAVLTLRRLIVEERVTADSLVALARAGKDFKKLVRENSVDPVTKARDGEWQTNAGRDAMVDSLTKNLKVGEIAGPGETREGFMILQLLAKKPAVPSPINLAWVHVVNDVRAQKEEVLLQELLKSLREKYKPEIHEEVLAGVTLGAPTEAPKAQEPKKSQQQTK
ncbi:MAG: peptidyl-prolyl cis-trans isomerase [Candidatus Eisenbacteria bacterium]|nr:peptidyl-prolyl cis-trans isomerase [Candidatus Eisenbacteria bacterium]